LFAPIQNDSGIKSPSGKLRFRTWYQPKAGSDGTIIVKWMPIVTLMPDALDTAKGIVPLSEI